MPLPHVHPLAYPPLVLILAMMPATYSETLRTLRKVDPDGSPRTHRAMALRAALVWPFVAGVGVSRALKGATDPAPVPPTWNADAGGGDQAI